MNTDKLTAFAVLMAASLSWPARAMEAPAADVEEIEVIGQRSLLALRMQVEAAQDEVHQLFNELNTDDDFDIVCKVEERLFSKIRQKNCMPRYAWNAHAREGQVFAQKVTGEAHAEGAPVDLEIDSYEPALKEQMVEALRHSPELFDAIVRHATLMQELADAQATYFGDGDSAGK